MVMTPMELDKRDFKKAVRGYSEEEVEYYISVVRADYETLYTENQELKVRLDDYELNIGKYRALEHTLNNTLIVAQQTAEELKRNAEKAAELILEEAKLKAQQRIHEAEAEIRKLSLQREDLLKRITELKVRLRAFLRAQLDLLDRTIDEDEDLLPRTSAKDAREAQEQIELHKPKIIKQNIVEPPVAQVQEQERVEEPASAVLQQDKVEEETTTLLKQEEPEQQVPLIFKKETTVDTVVNPFEQQIRPFQQEQEENIQHHNEEVATITETSHADGLQVEETQPENQDENPEDEMITAKSLINKAKKWVQRNKT